MSDNTSLTDKAAKAAAIGAGIVAGAALIDQAELMKKGLPGIWESIKGVAELNWLRLEETAKKFRPVAFRWLMKLWSLIKWWTFVSIALIVAGIEVKNRFGSNFGHVLVAFGAISISGLGLTVFTLSDGIAVIAYMGLKTCGSVFGKATSLVGFKMPDVIDEAKLAKFREKVRLVLAGTVVMGFSLLFTMFFPAYSTLGWTVVCWAPVAVAVVAAIHLDMKMGKAVRVVFYVTLALIVGMFAVFILDRLTGGSLGFGGFRKWLNAVNGSEVLAAVLVLVPTTLLLASAFAKDKDAKAAYKASAKYVGIGCAVLGAFLLYKGTISWKQLSGKETPKIVTETFDKMENASYSDLRSHKTETKAEPQGTVKNGPKYLTPPQMDAIVPPPDETANQAARTPKPRAKKPPLPPLKAKKYRNAADAVDDLESLL